jgi:hypothetical protein
MWTLSRKQHFFFGKPVRLISRLAAAVMNESLIRRAIRIYAASPPTNNCSGGRRDEL